MTAQHRTAEYMRNARIVRRIVNGRLAQGIEVVCIGCGWPIQEGQRFDVGHRVDATNGGSAELANLGPQHRGENRRAGGRLGAAITNAGSRAARRLPTW